MTIDVAVIGGGISGLATAHALKKKGLHVVVLERQARPGGNAISERIDGFLMEHGPSTVSAASEVARGLSGSLGLQDSKCDLGEGVKQRYLTRDGGLKGIPVHPMGFLMSDYLSLKGRLRIAGEVLVPRSRIRDSEETVAGFCARRFGPEFSERIMEALVGGLYAGSGSDLSVSAVFPKLVDLERRYGSVGLGVMVSRLKGRRMPGRRLYSWEGGIGTLPRVLAAGLGEDIVTGVAVRRLRALPGWGFTIDAGPAGTFKAANVVIATQPHVASSLLDDLDAPSAEAMAEIAAPPLSVVFLGYERGQVEHPLDGLGYLSAPNEGRVLTGAQFPSTMFRGRAPDGRVCLAGYLGGARNPDAARMSAEDIVGAARDEFRDLLGVRGEPLVARVRHWPLGLPQCGLGHGARVAAIRGAHERLPGLFLTGNYLSGPSVSACLEQALTVANVLARCHLKPVATRASRMNTG